MKTLIRLAALLLMPAAPMTTNAIPYRVGNIVTEVTNFVDRATGQPVPLSQLEGKILFIDFFAHWCPVCRAAAPQILEEIDEWYETRNGNPDGIPLLHIGANLQADSNAANRNATTRFIETYRIPLTIQDTSRALQGRFGPTSGQPTFVIINGLTNSASHRPWELIYARFSYQDSTQSRPIEAFRAAIDSVKAGPPLLSGLALGPLGELRLSVTGGSRAPLALERSLDLRQWTPTGVTIPVGTVFPYEVPGVTANSAAFFRVRSAE